MQNLSDNELTNESGLCQGYLAVVDLNKIATRETISTETLSLGDPPKSAGLPKDIGDWLSSGLAFLFFGVSWASLLNVVWYGLIFAVAVLITLLFWGPGNSGIEMFGVALSFAGPLFLVSFALFYILNLTAGTVLGGHVRVPKHMLRGPKERYKSMMFFDTKDLLFGHLTIRYCFNADGFYVVTQSDECVFAIGLPTINNVTLGEDNQLRDKWWRGRYDTIPVYIEIKSGKTSSYLRIHGAYFEQKERGDDRARHFANELRKLVPGLVSNQPRRAPAKKSRN